MAGVVIAGGGQAGFQTASSLRSEGYDGPITLISGEPCAPYQRPPLSKAFMLGKQDRERVLLRPEAYYAAHRIELLTGETVRAIDPPTHRVTLASGSELVYDALVLAVGARNRALPVPGAGLDGVCYLRTLPEAIELKQRIEKAERLVVIGGGFIGLEIAASARTLGKPVTIVEALPRLMARSVAPVVSEFIRQAHLAHGVDILLKTPVDGLRGGAGRVEEVLLGGGRLLAADLVVVGIGVLPNLSLAESAGLATANGICVNEFLQTDDPRIYAIGDCAEHPSAYAKHPGARVRLESVQNAVDQGLSVARAIAGRRAAYRATPWFWSDQFDLRLQMAGLQSGHDTEVVRGAMEQGKFSVFYFRRGKLCAVDSINRVADHQAARKLIGIGSVLTPEQACDESLDLKSLFRAAEVT